jgi:hypothetical protein
MDAGVCKKKKTLIDIKLVDLFFFFRLLQPYWSSGIQGPLSKGKSYSEIQQGTADCPLQGLSPDKVRKMRTYKH